jgi:type IV secretory pathway VirB6-like protein
MTHNKKDYEQWISIQPNDAAGLSAARLQQLYDQSMRLYKAEEELYYLVDTLDKKIAQVAIADTSKTEVKQKWNAMNELRKEILELNRKTIFFDEFKFRRRLCDLYVNVCTQTEPLSSNEEKGITVMEKELADISKRVKALL